MDDERERGDELPYLPCDTCNGTGEVHGWVGNMEGEVECDDCHGSGDAEGLTCPWCGGEGEILPRLERACSPNTLRCVACNGEGWITHERLQECRDIEAAA